MRVILEDDGTRVLLELDQGAANEVGRAEVARLAALVEQLEAPGVLSLVTFSRRRTARGTPVFCGGADVRERVDWDQATLLQHLHTQRETLRRLAAAPVFHVCVVDGLALGWGTEFLLAADYVLATPQARFGLPETGLGIVPGAGGTAHLARRVGPGHALRLGMTGEVVDSTEALRMGLVHEAAPDLEAGLERARTLCRRLAGRSPTAVAAYKAAVQAATELDAAARDDLEQQAYAWCVASGDAATGRQAFDEIRRGNPPAWGPRRRFHP